MLSLRRLQAMVLFVLAVLLIGTVGAYANHDLKTNSGWWEDNDGEQVFWKVTTGEHSWNSYNTHSWHRVFIQNHTEHNLTVEFDWIHEVTKVATNEIKKDNSHGVFSVASGTFPVSEAREGWLGPDVSGWLLPGMYELQSQTKVEFTNDANPSEAMQKRSVTKTTVFTVPEN